MSPIKTNRTTAGIAAVSARAKDAAAQAVPMGKRAGTTAVHGARQGAAGAKEWAAPRVQEAVREAREWAAPRLEDAADAVTTSVAPKVSSALRSTASQVRPRSPGQSGLRKLLDWRWLLGLGALMAAAGTTAAIAMRRRYASATADAEDAAADAAEPEAAAQAQAGDSADDSASVNGQVTIDKR